MFGCAGKPFELVPVPRAGDGAPPVKMQVRHLSWSDQPEGEDLAPGATVEIELDVYDADATRSFSVGAPQLVGRAQRDGATVEFEHVVDGGWFDLPVDPAVGVVRPHETRTLSAKFKVTSDDPPGGPLRLEVILPIAGQPALELAIADPATNQPRWRADGARVIAYAGSSVSFLSLAGGTYAFEPLTVAEVHAFGRWSFAMSQRFTYVYQEALAGGPPAFGGSLLARANWQPRTWATGFYAEGGAFFGIQHAPGAYAQTAGHWVTAPRVSAGLRWGLGRFSVGSLPFDRPASTLRQAGIKLGYTRWFHVDDRGGSGGLELAWEMGFSP
ncbi:MAG TPA: hypothetical protein VHJ20_23930 [Polyangia bacterium]|nr:hypothetical protein [Polyangia bacterium]